MVTVKVYINGKLIGTTDEPEAFVEEVKAKRRSNELTHELNITFYEENNEIFIFTDPGRARRPVVIVEDGKSMLTDEIIDMVAEGKMKWFDLIHEGIIEYIDAEEEENAYIAMFEEDLTPEHTHLEIDPSTMLGICAGIIPYANHNSSPRNTMEAGMTKQALGLYVSNYNLRTDTRAHLLHQPQMPVVKTKSMVSTEYDKRPSGQNFVVAILSYQGCNMEDALVMNKAALERGLGRSSFFRSYEASERRYPGGQEDHFEYPENMVRGYRSEEVYKNLDEDGLINPEVTVRSGDVLIGKTSPPRFLEDVDEFGTVAERRRETSVTVRHGEHGIVDKVMLTETIEGSKLAKVKVRDHRQPEYGDKFASRHGQKGVLGLIVPQENMPFNEEGMCPDLMINPHAIPSRMSIGQIIEMLAGKAGCMEGQRIDGTPFTGVPEEEIKRLLKENGFET